MLLDTGVAGNGESVEILARIVESFELDRTICGQMNVYSVKNTIMVAGTETVITSHPSKKHGISISRNLYDELSQFIVENLQTGKEVTSMSLLTDAEHKFAAVPNLNWYVMHVKLDLQAKGIIRMADSSAMRSKTLKLTPGGLKKFAEA